MITVLNILILLANIAVLGLSLKLYTEYFKNAALRKAVEEKR
jgi:Tfp pilus assembly major pilin PilA